MKTLQEYSDFLHYRGYKETFAPYTFLDGDLEIVEFEKDNYTIDLYIVNTDEFSEYLKSLEPGTEYKIDYKNYKVKAAFIESPICNVAGFLDGDTSGIRLVSVPDGYNKHTLELFEMCIGFQKMNLLEHELFIMSKRVEQLSWAKENLIPVLEKYDYNITYDTFFNTQNERPNSNLRLDLVHINREEIVIETDCLTGDLIIWAYVDGSCKNISNEIYGKNQQEVYIVLLENIWKKYEEKFGYIYKNDPHETVDTYREVGKLMDSLHYKEKKEINFDIIPERYKHLVDEYKKTFLN